jgi:non-ribosomal peptide synthetase component F
MEDVETSIPARFEKIVRMYPERLAVKDGDRSLTYDQLNRAANRIAHAVLAERGASSEPIPLLFEHGIDTLPAILGVLKAGKFYLGLDPSPFPRKDKFEC